MAIRSRVAVSVVVVSAAFAVWAGCVGDDPDALNAAGKKAGELGGDCFPNDTCNAGLKCFAKVCVPAEEAGTSGGAKDGGTGVVPGEGETEGGGGDGGGPGPGSDDAGSGSEDAGPGCTKPIPAGTSTVRCALNGVCANLYPTPCCVSQTAPGTCAPQPDGGGCPSETMPWQCTSTEQCPGSFPVCCLPKFTITSPVSICPPKATGVATDRGRCVAACDTATEVRLCSADAPCPGALACSPVTYRMGVVDMDFGYCK